MRKINKVGKGNGMIIGFVLIGLLVIGALFYLSTKQSVTPTPSEETPTGSCDSTTTPSVTINAYDVDNVGSALTEATNLYREKGTISWTNFTAGTAFDLSALKTYEVVMGITTSDQTDNAYGTYFEYTVPCVENPSTEKEMANDEIETSLTATFYNADGDAGAETFVAGDVQTVGVKLKAGNDEYFGNPFITGNPNVLVLALNSTEWDKPEEVYIEGGQTLKQVSTPIRQTLSTGLQYYAYELPVIGDREVYVRLTLNADDTTAPATDMTAYMYAGGYYINAETGEVEIGVEDEENTAVGTDAADTVTLDFTA